MPIPSAEQQYDEIFKFSPITSELHLPDYAAFCSRLITEEINPESFLFFCYFWQQFALFIHFEEKKDTSEKPLAHKIKPACDEFQKFCIEKKPDISKYDQRFVTLEKVIDRFVEILGRRGYIHDFNKCLAQLREDATPMKSHVIHNDVLKILLDKKFQEFILFFSTLRLRLEATYFTVIDEIGRLDTIVKPSVTPPTMPATEAASHTAVITPELIATLTFSNTTHIIPLPKTRAVLCYAAETRCLWNSISPSEQPCLAISEFTLSQAVVNIEERMLFMLGEQSRKPCLLTVSLFEGYKIQVCLLTSSGFLYASADNQIYLLLITGEIFTVNEHGQLKPITHLYLGPVKLIVNHLSFFKDEWHLIGVRSNHLSYFNLAKNWDLLSIQTISPYNPRDIALLKIATDDACNTIYFQNTSSLYKYQKSTKILQAIKPKLDMHTLSILNQDELLIVYNTGLFIRADISSEKFMKTLMLPRVMNALTLKKINDITTAYYTIGPQLYRLELKGC